MKQIAAIVLCLSAITILAGCSERSSSYNVSEDISLYTPELQEKSVEEYKDARSKTLSSDCMEYTEHLSDNYYFYTVNESYDTTTISSPFFYLNGTFSGKNLNSSDYLINETSTILSGEGNLASQHTEASDYRKNGQIFVNSYYSEIPTTEYGFSPINPDINLDFKKATSLLLTNATKTNAASYHYYKDDKTRSPEIGKLPLLLEFEDPFIAESAIELFNFSTKTVGEKSTCYTAYISHLLDSDFLKFAIEQYYYDYAGFSRYSEYWQDYVNAKVLEAKSQSLAYDIKYSFYIDNLSGKLVYSNYDSAIVLSYLDNNVKTRQTYSVDHTVEYSNFDVSLLSFAAIENESGYKDETEIVAVMGSPFVYYQKGNYFLDALAYNRILFLNEGRLSEYGIEIQYVIMTNPSGEIYRYTPYFKDADTIRRVWDSTSLEKGTWTIDYYTYLDAANIQRKWNLNLTLVIDY